MPNYWPLDAQKRSLECLILEAGDYRVDVSGAEDAELCPALFPGLRISLGRLWVE